MADSVQRRTQGAVSGADPATGGTSTAQMSSGGKASAHGAARGVLAATILASSLAFVDGSVVNVGLPAIGAHLHADPAALPWIINAYLLPLSALLLMGGAAGDRFGRRRLLVAGTLLFALASIACAAAGNLTLLLAGRLLQGVGAAILLPNSLAVLGQTFSGAAKGRAIGIWSATGAALGAVGPVLGGWLIDSLSWRAIFLINLPIALGAVVLAQRYVPRDSPAFGARLDWAGGLLATGALSLLTFALTSAGGPAGWDAVALTTLALGVVTSIGFLVVEWRASGHAMMPLALFGSRQFVGLTLFTLLLYGALGELLVLVPYVLIEAARTSAVEAGAALLPVPILLAVASPFMGAWSSRIGARLPLTLGAIVVGVGFCLALRVGTPLGYWMELMPMLVVIAVGLSAAVAPLTTAVLGSVDAEHTGSASGLNSAVARTGGLVATALLGPVLAFNGATLVARFHVAMLWGALACLSAAAAALFLLGRPKR